MANGIYFDQQQMKMGVKNQKPVSVKMSPIFLINTYIQSTLYYSAPVSKSSISLINFKKF